MVDISTLAAQLKLEPDNQDLYLALGEAQVKAAHYEAALTTYQTAVQRFPKDFKFLFNAGFVLEQLKRWPQACACYEQVLEQDADCFEAWVKRGEIYQRLHLSYQASVSFWQAWQLRPDYFPSFGHLLEALMRMGQMARVAELCGPFFDGSFAKAPWYTGLSNEIQAAIARETYRYHALFLIAHFCLDQVDSAWLISQFKRWGSRYFPTRQRQFPSRDQGQPLRVAYLSNEWGHPQFDSLYHSLFAHQNTDTFTYLAYNDGPQNAQSDALHPFFSAWKPVQSLTNQQLLNLCWQDKVDILVDLSGLLNIKRLEVLNERAAPLQIYAGTHPPFSTGLNCYDARWTDAHLWPQALASQLSEPPYTLSSFIHLTPPKEAPFTPCPFETQGHITFGSAHVLSKLSPAAIALWILLLKQLPEARFKLKSPAFIDPETQAYWLARFMDAEIAPERIDLLGPDLQSQPAAPFYQQIDIALDPFPDNGQLSILEALWMGVPVVALEGGRFQAQGILQNLGLAEMLQPTPEAYLETAIAWAKNPEQLKEWRQHLRAQIQDHAIFDGQRFAQEVEQSFQTLWQARETGF